MARRTTKHSQLYYNMCMNRLCVILYLKESVYHTNSKNRIWKYYARVIFKRSVGMNFSREFSAFSNGAIPFHPSLQWYCLYRITLAFPFHTHSETLFLRVEWSRRKWIIFWPLFPYAQQICVLRLQLCTVYTSNVCRNICNLRRMPGKKFLRDKMFVLMWKNMLDRSWTT